MNLNPLRDVPRNAEVGALHLSFFVAAVTTILCIRTELWLTHYPQLGGHGLHIAHLLWGGLFMVIAIGILLSLLGRRARRAAAILAGVGFAFFIDELGKFVTADNNYFFKPAAGIIYVVFILLFLASRAFQHRRGLNEAEDVRNAIELIGEATQGPFRREYRDRALALLREVSPAHPLHDPLVALARQIDTTPDPDPPWYERLAANLADRYRGWVEHRWFQRLVIAVFVVWAASSVLTVVGLVLGGGGDSIRHLSFVNWASLISTAVSALLVVVGLGRLLEGDRPDAYAWLSRALLVSIFITRVFSFVESQFGAVFGLAIDVGLLVTLQLMARQERRQARASAHRRPLAAGSAAPGPG